MLRAGMLAIGLTAGLAAGPLGCEKPLFPSDMPRTQYDRYDRLHGRYVPAKKQSRRGTGSEPALRQRLQPYSP